MFHKFIIPNQIHYVFLVVFKFKYGTKNIYCFLNLGKVHLTLNPVKLILNLDKMPSKDLLLSFWSMFLWSFRVIRQRIMESPCWGNGWEKRRPVNPIQVSKISNLRQCLPRNVVCSSVIQRNYICTSIALSFSLIMYSGNQFFFLFLSIR